MEGIYECSGCKTLKKSRSVTVVNGRIVGKKHPEDDHHPDCEPVPQNVIDALSIDREMRFAVNSQGKRPRDAFDDALSSIPKKFKTSEEQQAILQHFPTFTEVRTQLSRHRTAQHIPVPDPLNIPVDLCVTFRGRHVSRQFFQVTGGLRYYFTKECICVYKLILIEYNLTAKKYVAKQEWSNGLVTSLLATLPCSITLLWSCLSLCVYLLACCKYTK